MQNSKTGFDPIDQAIQDIKDGKIIILTDDEDRENEGDLVCSAEKVTPEIINFMASHGKGLICLPMDSILLDRFSLRQMVENNEESHRTNFTISVDARQGITTGISAKDRAHTIQVMLDSSSTYKDIVSPGHVFPLRARSGGVLRRAGHTEAAVDLARIAGLAPAGVICEIMNDDGEMARLSDLLNFKQKFNLTLCSISELIEYRRRKEHLVHRMVETRMPTPYGEFKIVAFETTVDDLNHVALVLGEIKKEEPTLVRVHSECLTGEVFKSQRCDCGEQLENAFQMISQHGSGVILYMRQEGRGIGLINKLKAYQLQDQGMDTVEANVKLGFKDDLREYGIGAQILKNLGVGKIRLLTNNPRKIVGLEGYQLEVVEQLPIKAEVTDENRKYLHTKQVKLGHFLHIEDRINQ